MLTRAELRGHGRLLLDELLEGKQKFDTNDVDRLAFTFEEVLNELRDEYNSVLNPFNVDTLKDGVAYKAIFDQLVHNLLQNWKISEVCNFVKNAKPWTLDSEMDIRNYLFALAAIADEHSSPLNFFAFLKRNTKNVNFVQNKLDELDRLTKNKENETLETEPTPTT